MRINEDWWAVIIGLALCILAQTGIIGKVTW